MPSDVVESAPAGEQDKVIRHAVPLSGELTTLLDRIVKERSQGGAVASRGSILALVVAEHLHEYARTAA